VYPNSPRALSPLSTGFLPRARSTRTPIRAVSPLFVAFTPNRSLTPLSTAFTQSHRGVGYLSDFLLHDSPWLRGKSILFIRLRALELSCRSFCSSDRLFSMAYTLFCKIPGVWVSRTVSRDTRDGVPRVPHRHHSSRILGHELCGLSVSVAIQFLRGAGAEKADAPTVLRRTKSTEAR
jgi:hypothetical protein